MVCSMHAQEPGPLSGSMLMYSWRLMWDGYVLDGIATCVQIKSMQRC